LKLQRNNSVQTEVISTQKKAHQLMGFFFYPFRLLATGLGIREKELLSINLVRSNNGLTLF